MININFVPDDYIQNKESRKANLVYMGLLAVVMMVLFGSFAAIKLRQQEVSRKEKALDEALAKRREDIRKVEELQKKRNAMWTTAITTADLLEGVPKSLVLASLTNSLPRGVSLISFSLVQKEPAAAVAPKTATPSKYQSMQERINTVSPKPENEKPSLEKMLDTLFDIEGIAPSDIEVASYIEKLSSTPLFAKVELVESKEYSPTNRTAGAAVEAQPAEKFRRFRLTAMLNKDASIVDEQVNQIALAVSQ